MTKPQILQVGPYPEWDQVPLDEAFTVHRYFDAADKAGSLAEVGPSVKGIATRGELGATRAMIDAFQGGDPTKALEIFTRLLPAIDAVMGVPNYGATTAKAGLQLLGVLDNRNVRGPLVPLTDAEVADLRVGLEASGLL